MVRRRTVLCAATHGPPSASYTSHGKVFESGVLPPRSSVGSGHWVEPPDPDPLLPPDPDPLLPPLEVELDPPLPSEASGFAEVTVQPAEAAKSTKNETWVQRGRAIIEGEPRRGRREKDI